MVLKASKQARETMIAICLYYGNCSLKDAKRIASVILPILPIKEVYYRHGTTVYNFITGG